jgi:hypothetical protein
MRWTDVSFTDRTIRQFAALSVVFFLALALWQACALNNRIAALLLATIAGVVGPLGWRRPRLLRPIYVAAVAVSFPLGWTISHVMLALLYFALFTPIGMLFRLMKRDSLKRRFRPDVPTYWEERQTRAISDYWRQY